MFHNTWKPIFDQYDFDLDDIYDVEVYPPRHQIFRAFQIPVQEIKVVLLGQDPYHGPGQADGLSFSVPVGTAIPPSLLNIFKELKRCFPERNYTFPSGNLDEWLTREKIFLCNTSLTVEKGKPGSHMDLWKEFTDEIIQYIDKHNKTCVFLLLGNFAKSKASLISKKDRIVTEIHPSPLAAASSQNKFVGSGVFQRVEKVLGTPVNWSNGPSNKQIIYVDCDAKVCGQEKMAITLDSSLPKPYVPMVKPKLSRLERMVQDPQTVQEQAVQAYVEYSKANNLEIKVDDINDLLTS